ncbi:MAG: hypothetical protein LRS46_02515 [Desulfurococcales archaeon]|nr:hypothetical protein [Desulfurococcales archaeon]
MSARVTEEVVNAPYDIVYKYLLEKARVLSMLPSNVLRPLDNSYNVVEISIRRGIFGLRGVFETRIESSIDSIVYVFESPRARINVTIKLERRNERTLIGVEVEGIGINLNRFRDKINNIVSEWIKKIKNDLEVKAEASLRRAEERREVEKAIEPKVSLTTREANARGAQADAVEEPDALLAGSERLADPIFEAESLLRGKIRFVGTMLLTKIADIVDRLTLMEEFDASKTYLVKISMSGLDFSVLIEKGRVSGALLRTPEGETVKGLEALKRIQNLMPGEAHLTVIEL